MSELTVRTPAGGNLNICDSEWLVYQEDKTWYKIDPLDDLRVRHGTGEYWLTVECDNGTDYCPPEEMVDCWPGYAGDFDSGTIKTGGPTGYLLVNCDGTAPKTYTGHTSDFNVAGGRFLATAPVLDKTIASALPVTFFGDTAEVNEMLVYAGTASGAIDVSGLGLDPGVRFRVYHGCDLLGDSKLSGDYFNIFYNAEPPKSKEDDDCGTPPPANNFLTVRVDAPAGARWRVKLGAVNVVQLTNYERPAPCFGTFGPNVPCFVNDEHRVIPGNAVYEMIHHVTGNGRMHIDLTVNGAAPVTISVFYRGTLIATGISDNTVDKQYSAMSIPFQFTPLGGDEHVIVRYESPRNYNKWQYAIYCAEQRGSRVWPMFCMPVPDDVLCLPLNESLDPTYAIVGGGAAYNDVYYDYSGKAEGDIVVEFFAPSPVQMIFYQGTYPNDVVVGGTDGFVSGHQRFYFEFYPANGTVIHARVFGPCCPDWAFTVSCPVPFARLIIDDGSQTRLKKGEVNYLCFRARLNHRTPRDVDFSFKTTPITAIETDTNDCLIHETVTASPFCDILYETGVQYAYSYNDTNIGGYGASRICSMAHGYNCAAAWQFYVMETEIDLPYDGAYTWVGTADDNVYVYFDCELKVAKGSRWEAVDVVTVQLKKGLQSLSIMYQNVPNCTPGWVKFALIGAGGQIVFRTDAAAYTWRSKAGPLDLTPAPVPIDYGADYTKTQSVGHIPACSETGVDICVPICGTDLMGPNVTFQVDIFNLTGVKAERPAAIGTIINENFYECDQNTEIAVKDGGANIYINRLSRNMFVQKSVVSNGSASYVMDTKLTVAASGLYTFLFFGTDNAEFYVDCNLIARSTGVSQGRATRVRTAMNRGEHNLYINYGTFASKVQRNGYAALCILDPQNQIIYSSKASDWRGRIVNAGTGPSCDQFPVGNNGVPLYNTWYRGRVMTHISSSIAYGGTNYAWWSAERDIVIPADGLYYCIGGADDQLGFYIGCMGRSIGGGLFQLEAGPNKIQIRCYNLRSRDPNYFWFTLYNQAGQVIYDSAAPGWRGKWSDLDFSGLS